VPAAGIDAADDAAAAAHSAAVPAVPAVHGSQVPPSSAVAAAAFSNLAAASSQVPPVSAPARSASRFALLDAKIAALKAAQGERAAATARGGAARAAVPALDRPASFNGLGSNGTSSLALLRAQSDQWRPERIMSRTPRTDVLLRIEIALPEGEGEGGEVEALGTGAGAGADERNGRDAGHFGVDGTPMLHSSSAFGAPFSLAASAAPVASGGSAASSLALPLTSTALKREISPSVRQHHPGRDDELNGKRQRTHEHVQPLGAAGAASAAASSSVPAVAAVPAAPAKKPSELKALDDDDDDDANDVEMSDAPSPRALALAAAAEAREAEVMQASLRDAADPRVIHRLWAESRVLVHSSQYFARMLSSASRWAERAQGVITLPVPDRETGELLAALIASVVVDDRAATGVATPAHLDANGAELPPARSAPLFGRSASMPLSAAAALSLPSSAGPAVLPPSSSPTNPLLSVWHRRLLMLPLAHFYLFDRQLRLLCHLLARDLLPSQSRLERTQQLLFDDGPEQAAPALAAASAVSGVPIPSVRIPPELRSLPPVRRLLAQARRRFLEHWCEIAPSPSSAEGGAASDDTDSYAIIRRKSSASRPGGPLLSPG